MNIIQLERKWLYTCALGYHVLWADVSIGSSINVNGIKSNCSIGIIITKIN